MELEQLVLIGRVRTLHEAYDELPWPRLQVFLAAQDLDRAGVVRLRPTGTCDVAITPAEGGDQ